MEVVSKISRAAGGLVVFLEAELEDKLLAFYNKENNGFKVFSQRISKGIEEKHTLLRLLKVL